MQRSDRTSGRQENSADGSVRMLKSWHKDSENSLYDARYQHSLSYLSDDIFRILATINVHHVVVMNYCRRSVQIMPHDTVSAPTLVWLRLGHPKILLYLNIIDTDLCTG